MGALFALVAVAVELVIVGLVIWQAKKRFGRKGLLIAISAVAALVLFSFTWNCCTSWNSEAPVSANLTTGAKRTVGKHYVFWKRLVSPAANQSNH